MTLKQLFVLAGLSFIFVTATAMTPAQQTTRIYLQPVKETETALIVDVIVENISNLYGIDFEILYDSSALTVQDALPMQNGVQIEPGSMLPGAESFVVTNQVDPFQGTISFAAAMLYPAPPVEKGGVLARISFDRVQLAPLAFQFEHARLVSSDLQPVPLQTVTLLLDSRLPENAEMVLSPMSKKIFGDAFPWWLVATLILALGLLTLGGYLVLDHGQSSSSVPPAAIKSARQESTQLYQSGKSQIITLPDK
jgi:hypothetical protein